MDDFIPRTRPVLANKSPCSSDAINLRPLPEGTLVQILVTPGNSGITTELDMLAGKFKLDVRGAGPGQWFLVSDAIFSASQIHKVIDCLPEGATGIDQSHGQVRIGIEGPQAVTVLAKGTAVDLAVAAFAVGHTTNLLFSHVAAHLTRVADNAFELTVQRSFAESLWDDLGRMAAEFLTG